MKKLIVASLMLSLLLAPMEADAVVQFTSLKASVTTGTLTLLVPTNFSLNAINVSALPTETTGVMTGINVQDLRGKNPPLGWSLNMYATDFKTLNNDKIAITQLKLIASAYRFINGKDGGITVPGTVSFTDANNDGTSDAISLMSAAAGSGGGDFAVDPILKLIVPAFSVAGDYQSTVTLTLI